jgi:rhodanese-related sulfurtransferase
MPITTSVHTLVAQAMSEVTTYTAAQVKERLAAAGSGKPIQLVDIRDVRELSDGTAVGSFHAPRCMLEFWVDPASPYHKPLFANEDKEFVLFCAAGWRSALATKTLQDMGMRNVSHIEGGYAEWVKQGGPTETLEQRKANKASAKTTS